MPIAVSSQLVSIPRHFIFNHVFFLIIKFGGNTIIAIQDEERDFIKTLY